MAESSLENSYSRNGLYLPTQSESPAQFENVELQNNSSPVDENAAQTESTSPDGEEITLLPDDLYKVDISKSKLKNYLHKETVSNIIFLIIAAIGVTLVEILYPKAETLHIPLGVMKFLYVFRAVGIFGFAGGVTNWLAVKMLFDKIPGFIGSGVVTNQFKEIRDSMKYTVLDTFFDENYLTEYLHNNQQSFTEALHVGDHMKGLMQSQQVDDIIIDQVNKIYTKPEGVMLAMVGLDASKLKAIIKPLVTEMSEDIITLLMSNLDSSQLLNTISLREQINAVMTAKLEELTATQVKKLVEIMIRNHLGWLVVWGNFFGALIGFITEIATQFV